MPAEPLLPAPDGGVVLGAGEVLDERASPVDVEDLEPAADAEHRHAQELGLREQCLLCCVPCAVADVLSAREQQAVEPADERGDVGFDDVGHQQRDAPGGLHRVGVLAAEGVEVGALSEAGRQRTTPDRDADDRPGHAPSSIHVLFTSVYLSTACAPLSRPKPLSPTPPNGIDMSPSS